VRLRKIERGVYHRGDLGVGQDHTRLPSPQRFGVALPAREKIGRERDVAVLREALGEVERVLHEAVALVQDDDRARGRFVSRQVEEALAVPGETDLVRVAGHLYFSPLRK